MRLDLLIVGAGPAGVSAGLWARELGLSATVVESALIPGGQLQHVHFSPRDVAGVRAVDGPAIASLYALQLADAGVPLVGDRMAASLELPIAAGERPSVLFTTGERLEARAVLIATGARRRRLDVPGERELEGHGVSYSATRDRGQFAGRPVVVVGGGDAAYENALILADAGCDVTLLVRRLPRARPQFISRVAHSARIQVRTGVTLLEILGERQVRGLRISDSAGDRELACTGVVIKAGVIPNSEWCRTMLAHDEAGYLRVDGRHATSAPHIWAAGDVTRPLLPSIPVAMSHGAEAVASIRETLESN